MFWRRRIRFLLFTVILLLGLAGVTEGIARNTTDIQDIVFDSANAIYVDHPTLFWTLRPSSQQTQDGKRIISNALGFRSPELTIPKPEGVRRVLFLGESSTMGVGVGQDSIYAYRVGAHLAARGWDFLNAGIGAWTVWQSRTLMLDQGARLQPDVVVLYHRHNDFLPTQVRDSHNYLYGLRYTDRELEARRRPFALPLQLLFKSQAYLVLRKQVLMRSTIDLPVMHQEAAQRSGRRVPDADRLEALESIASVSEKIGAKVIVVIPHYDADFSYDRLLPDFAARHAFAVVDVEALMRQEGISGGFLRDGIHPSEYGHACIARWIDAVIDTMP